jgi:hypothetical protein
MNARVEVLHWRVVLLSLKKKIEKALKHGGNTYSFEALKRAIQTERFKLLYTNRAILVVEIISYPNYKVVNMFLTAGDIKQCVMLSHRACAWGRENGCKYAIGTGRAGWERVVRDLGWKRFPTTTMIKEL